MKKLIGLFIAVGTVLSQGIFNETKIFKIPIVTFGFEIFGAETLEIFLRSKCNESNNISPNKF